jgi:hypothetical protein
VRALAAVTLLAGLVASTAAAGGKKPALTVTQRFVGGQFYIEGSIGYLRVRTRDGRLVAAKTFAGARHQLRFRLAPGRYTLVSFQRPCDGNCGYLDPPTDRCSRPLLIRRRNPVSARVEISPGAGCTIRLA